MGQAIANREVEQAQIDLDEPWDAAEAIQASRDGFAVVRKSRLCEACQREVELDIKALREALGEMAEEEADPVLSELSTSADGQKVTLRIFSPGKP